MEMELEPTTGVPDDHVTTISDDVRGDAEKYYYDLSEKIFIAVDPVILILGVVGNMLTITIMNRPSLRSSSVSVYLSALAVSDTLVLILDFLNNWFKMALKIYLMGMSEGFCKFHRFVFDTAFTYSSWLVVAVSIERFLVVWFPLKAKALCTRKVAHIVTCVLPLVSLCVYMYKAFVWGLDENGKCNMHHESQEFESNIGPWLSGTLYSYIPITALLFLNALIAVRLTRMAGEREKMTGEGHHPSGQGSKERRITIMVFVICVTFIILTAPLAIFYIMAFAIGEFVYTSPKIALVETFILIIGLSNYAVNFFLYVLTSEGFRRELKSLMCCTLWRSGSFKSHGSTESTPATDLSVVSKSNI